MAARALATFVFLAWTAASSAGMDDNPPWTRFEVATAQAALSGKPILFFVSTDLAPGATTLDGGLDRMFGARILRPRWGEFHWVKVADLKSMDLVKANAVNELIITDPDLNELFRGTVKTAPEAEKGINDALKKYVPRPIPYKTYDATTFKQATGKPLILVFADTAKDSVAVLTALEQPMLARYTEKCDFARFVFKKDEEGVKKWNVVSSPTIIVLDTSKEEGQKAISERAPGKKSAPELKALILRALKICEKQADR
jgi:hypothetical protein